MAHRVVIPQQHGPLDLYLRPLEGCPNLEAFAQAIPEGVPLMWLDSARDHPVTGRWSLLGYDPWLTLTARGDWLELRTSAAARAWRANPLDALRQVLNRYRFSPPSQPHTRVVGLMGWLGYELNQWIERLPAPPACDRGIPDMAWCAMRVSILVDHLQQRGWLVSVVDPHRPAPLAHREALEAMEAAEARLASSGDRREADAGALGEASGCDVDSLGSDPWRQAQATSGGAHAGLSLERSRGTGMPMGLQATSTRAEFEAMVERALEHIRAGDIFQANVSQRFTAPWRGGALPLYRMLQRINPSPFSCFLSWEDLAVVSCSPERLVRVEEGRVSARPIAGTRPRGATPTDDTLNSLDLLLSEKERAEHIMLVDLARNDLGRLCAVGSVAVGELMGLEAYSHVLHIVSDVSGTLRGGLDAVDVIRAVFPGGTITGCPKVRCMEILRALEPVARGLYTGSLGYLSFDGTMDLNIAIRTMVIKGGRLSFHVGAGVVADSQPEREYDETLAKAAALLSALRAVDGRFAVAFSKGSQGDGRAASCLGSAGHPFT